MARPRGPKTPFYRFNSSSEVIRLVVMMYVKYPLSPRNVEDLLFEREIDVSYERVRYWWNRFRPMKTLQKFSPVHASVHNHFNHERHLTSRQAYKDQRSAALAEWQSFVG